MTARQASQHDSPGEAAGSPGPFGRVRGGLAVTACGLVLAACSATGSNQPSPAAGSATSDPVTAAVPVESNPPGDIPDTIAYVAFRLPDGSAQFTHPEGWTQTPVLGGVTFTDKLNSVTVTVSMGAVPTVEQVRRQVVPTLGGPGRAAGVWTVDPVTLPAGPAVRVVWRVNSEPDAVTGKVYRDEVESYFVGAAGRVVRMDLAGAVGSDNVDPYRTMTQSLRLP